MSDAPDGPPPLRGVKVLDLSNYLAAPMATMYLADYGAEVIKVEQPGRGDGMRMWGNNKNGVGLYFKVIRRNKKSVTLDFHTLFGFTRAGRYGISWEGNAPEEAFMVRELKKGKLSQVSGIVKCRAEFNAL